ncbi:TlpA disulfide reductase family protein [Pedobacter agri]|uniref:TlpA disulfide reductase family protein n=1 Tax=Pedobacter agri TaxID=454586 RepID=A0A9X3DDD2_9SPHI|nr:TlpA disulfide reductase family protein [Pedobacter agri]MCX3265628.1 TlpA disulfide reductase family protein [Pedobacter agri]
MTTLIVCLCCGKVFAQDKYPVSLSVGDKVPSLIWREQLTAVSVIGENTISLADFKDKAIILDFWTSWCAPCLKNMPILDSIHRENNRDLKVIMMNASISRTGYDKEQKFIRQFLTDHQNFFSPLTLRSDLYRKYFYFRVVPHYVWIGADGKVKALTDHTQFSKENISRFISGKSLSLTPKTQ